MTDSMKSRLAIDLSALEQQLRSAQGQPTSSRERNDDPLSELARIVGQDDPFRTLLASEQPRRPASETSRLSRQDRNEAKQESYVPELRPAARPFDEPRFSRAAATAQPASQARFAQPIFDAPPARAGFDHHPAHDDRAHAANADLGQDSDYDEYAYSEEAAELADQADYAEDQGEPATPPVAARRSRKGLIAVVAVLGVAVIGVAAALSLKGSGSSSFAGEPPVIKADNAPTKIQPQNPGGAEVPNQSKQIYERVAHTQETKVVDRSEQPVDVNQAVRRDVARVALAETSGAPTLAQPPQQPNPTLTLGEPKRVKTVAVKPDGSVMADVVPVAPKPKAAATTPATPQIPPKPASLVEARDDSGPTSRPSAGMPLSIAPFADNQARPAPQPRRVATTAPAEEIASPASTASTGVSSGAYTVQLAAPGSDKEAREAFANLQRKYSSDLGSYEPIIRKVETGGRTIYRLRVGALSREAATSLCSRLQAAGGACFVAKN